MSEFGTGNDNTNNTNNTNNNTNNNNNNNKNSNNDLITIATVECFTLGKIGIYIHKIASKYPELDYFLNKNPEYIILHSSKVLTAMFMPSKEIAETFLNIALPNSDYDYNYSKAYSQENDELVAELMAKGLKNITKCNIAIGTTAGIGKGAICIITDKKVYNFTSDVEADLLTKQNVSERQKNAIEKTIKKILDILKEEYNCE
ncbi:UPF0254 family protein [Methanococcus voltae]|uniref:UPF0254 protein Mvol_0952 n=1 Tax=Methanococcus voltae (strain ATCC BAA-1334 / A3) TaxID=456320 RepID=D7DTZ9_METV3|nr:UPF0254 family protein [Methanococcus voltae]MCS3900409.1 uncharacterized protein (UPF0254 family) [Methanococcus voltae]